MFKALLNQFVLSVAMVPVMAHSQIKQDYYPPAFSDTKRLQKIATTFPAIDKIFQDYAKKNHLPGYAFGIVVDGKLVHSGSGGYANVEKKIPATPQSMFRIASMTKSFTATAILKLRDEGKLKLDDPVYLYIPQIKKYKLTNDAPEITIRNLLIHSQGFPQDDPWADRKLAETDEQLISLFAKGISFSNAPGINFEYSNLGYAMLGYIVKTVSGLSYQDYIAKNIWQPLGMTQAAWEFSKIPANQIAQGYKNNNGNWQAEEFLHDGSYGAMGGMFASIESFSKYAALHQSAWPPRDDEDKGILKRSSLREMHHPWNFREFLPKFKYADGRECALMKAYGYGLVWMRDCENKLYIRHSGGLPGFGSNWTIMPDYGIGVIFFSNLTYATGDEANIEVLEKIIQLAHLKPKELPPSTVLKEKQAALIKLLPNWQAAKESGIFADNFFLDHSVDSLQKEALTIFAKAGKITRVGDIVPENQLRGHFILKGEKANIKLSFTLTPEKNPLIQAYQIENV